MATQLTSDGIIFGDSTVQITKTTRRGRNRIINGAMEVDQRRNGAVITQPGYTDYITVDRIVTQGSIAGKYSLQQNLNAVMPPLGFSKYIGVKSLSAYPLVASSYFMFGQYIEGTYIADLKWGTAYAKSVTISFWVQSSLTGTFNASIRNGPLTHSYNFTYLISSANTWTKIIVSVPAPTSGVWYTDINIGIRLLFNIGTGSTYSTNNANVWELSSKFGVTGAVSIVSTLNATFFITGLQFEEGTVATEFEKIPYDEELVKCQRYYQIAYANTRAYCAASSILTSPVQYYTTMRTDPTVVLTAGSRSANLSVVSIVAAATTASHRVGTNATAGDTYALIEKCEFNAEVAEVSSFTIASGGTETTYAADGFTYKVHTFLTSATFTVTQAGRSTGDLDVLIVAGGGGGGATGSGGGAGGMIATKMYLPATGAYSITVGAGGLAGVAAGGSANGGAGSNSVFGELIAVGGGPGVSHHIGNGIAGGSGGGGSIMPTTSGSYPGGAGTAGQGNAGGAGFAAGGSWPGCSGGGGGAGEAGIAGGNSAGNGRGGNGLQNNYRTGSAVYYAGGGGGGEVNGAVAGAGGLGGGGSAVIDGAGGAGTNGLGGGGAGGSYNGNYFNGGAGGSGIVVVRYRTA